ncbi:MAG: hypothetical protein FWG36_03785 [Oscillospiraceae bacterium]|nr:hypothetical protein [Oscillospiraceae bacterium]
MNSMPLRMPEQLSEPLDALARENMIVQENEADYLTEMPWLRHPMPEPQTVRHPMPEPEIARQPMPMPERANVRRDDELREEEEHRRHREEDEHRRREEDERRNRDDGRHNERNEHFERLLPLWWRHMLWTHTLVNSVLDGRPDVQKISRLVTTNNGEILDHMRPNISNDTAKAMAEALNQNLVYTVQMAQSIRGGNRKNADESWERLSANSERLIDIMCEHYGMPICMSVRRDYNHYLETMRDEMPVKSGRRL